MFIFVLTVLLVIPCSVFAQADATLTDFEITQIGLNDTSVRTAVVTYFSQRNNYLTGEAETINVASVPLFSDEALHLAAMQEAGVIRAGMQIAISSVYVGDTYAEAVVEENITYVKEGKAQTEVVEHIITVYTADDTTPIIASDGFYESFSGFTSCSYLSEATAATTTVTSPGGSSLCIIHVAEGEIGYAETGTNITKYGQWYGGNGQPWCAMFVSWCANQANVSTSIIVKNWGCDRHMNHFKNNSRFYMSAAYGGTTAPQAGDIIFFGPSQSDSTHMGIVTGSDSSKVYYIDGNNSHNDVRAQSRSLTASNILGYGRPAYATTIHTYAATGESIVDDTENHKASCVDCGAEGTLPHNMEYAYNSNYHWLACTDCGYEGAINSHLLRPGVIGGPPVCRVCGYESYVDILDSIVDTLIMR